MHSTSAPGFQQRGHPLCVISGVDARAHQIALLAVQQLQRDFPYAEA